MNSIEVLQRKTGAPEEECGRALELAGGSIVAAAKLLKRYSNRIPEQIPAPAERKEPSLPIWTRLLSVSAAGLIADALVSLCAALILFILLPWGRPLSGILGAGSCIALFLAADFLVPFYVMRIFRDYSWHAGESSLPAKIALTIASFTILFLFIGFPSQIIRINGDVMAFLPFLYFTGIWSAFCGGLTGYGFPSEDGNKKDKTGSTVLGIALMSPPVFGVVLHALGAFNWFERLLMSESKNAKRFISVTSKIALPVIVIITLALVQQVYIEGSAAGTGNNGSEKTSYVYFFLVLSGIIPLRIISGFAPPFRPLNLLAGVVSSLFYLYSVHSSILALAQ